MPRKCGIQSFPIGQFRRRYTCLGEPFTLRAADILLVYRNRNFKETFYILPRRVDNAVLLGRQWTQKMMSNNSAVTIIYRDTGSEGNEEHYMNELFK